MKKIILSLSCMLLLMASASAQFGKKKTYDAEGMDDEYRDLPHFDAVKVTKGVDLYIHQAEEQQVRVQSGKTPMSRIKTEVKDGELLVTYRTTFWSNFKMGKAPRVDIWIDDLESITAWGGSDIYTEGRFETNSLRVRSGGGSDVSLDIKAQSLTGKSSGGSDLHLSGEVKEVSLRASGGSDIKAYKLQTEKCTVHSSGGSDAFVNVSGEVSASASGGSDVHIRGTANVISQKASGGSDINFSRGKKKVL